MKCRMMARVLALMLSVVMLVGLLPIAPAWAVNIDPPAEENFTLLWTTDPQWYSFAYPEIITFQNQWVVDNFSRLDMRYVLFTGDYVDNPHSHEQWAVMDKAYKIWDDAGIPYGAMAGNHDVDTKNGIDHTEFSQYFGRARYQNNWWYGGDYDDNYGHYDLMTIEGVKFIFMYLGYGPHEQAHYDWMNSVLKQYPNHIAILNFHDYLQANGTRSPRGDIIFDEVVLKNPNVRMVLCGHNYNSTRLVEEVDDNGDGKADRTVFQMMANYQSTTKGGNGFMRFMECDVADGTITHRTYSPYIGQFGSDYEDGTILDEYGYRDSFVMPFDFSAPSAKGANDPVSGKVVKTPEMSFAPTASAAAVTLPVVYQNKAESGNIFKGVGVYDRFFSIDAADAFQTPKALDYVYATYANGSYTVSKVVHGSELGNTKPLVPTASDSIVIAVPADGPLDTWSLEAGRKVMLNKLTKIQKPVSNKSVQLNVPSCNGTFNIDGINHLAGNNQWVIIDRLCEVPYTHEWDLLFLFEHVSGSTYKLTERNTSLGTAKDIYIPEGAFLLAVNTAAAGSKFISSMETYFAPNTEVTLKGHVAGEPPIGSVVDLLAPSVSAWTYDAANMAVEQTADELVLYKTGANWPEAQYTYPTPIKVDPTNMVVHYDYMIETGAQTNIQLHFASSTPSAPVSGQYVRIHKYFDGAYISSNSGDAKGDDVRRSGNINLNNVDIPAACYNADGTLTLNGITVVVAGSAQYKQHYYDFSLRSDISVDDSALSQNIPLLSGNITVTDESRVGGYVYDNGDLTVMSDSDDGYEVVINLDRTFNVAKLKNWIVNVSATTPFDVRLNVTTAGDDMTFGLAPDFWPALCAQTVHDGIPAGAYTASLDLSGCYTYNQVLPSDGKTTVKQVIVKLVGKGTLEIDALQMSNTTVECQFSDGVIKSAQTPAFILGDTNGDSDISTSDARLAMLQALTEKALTGTALLAADYNGDGNITTTDARLIMLHALTH